MNSTRFRRCALGLATVAALLSASGCGDDSTGTAMKDKDDADPPEAIVCTVGGDYSGTVTAKRTHGATEGDQGKEFGPMRLAVQYLESTGEGTAVTVVVTDSGDRELTRVLYQIGTPLDEVEFQGGHGFTGLHYVTHKDRQLQFWCEPK